MNPQFTVNGDIHVICSLLPGLYFRRLKVGSMFETFILFRVGILHFLNSLDGKKQVLTRHQIGISVIVDYRRIFIRAGYAINAELASLAFRVKTKVFPHPRCLYQHLRPLVVEQRFVISNIDVLFQGIHNISIDMVLSRPGRIIG